MPLVRWEGAIDEPDKLVGIAWTIFRVLFAQCQNADEAMKVLTIILAAIFLERQPEDQDMDAFTARLTTALRDIQSAAAASSSRRAHRRPRGLVGVS
jgi:hypothetical protein